jgi:hypothetical protein
VFKGTSPWSASSLLWQFKVRKKNEIIEIKMFMNCNVTNRLVIEADLYFEIR